MKIPKLIKNGRAVPLGACAYCWLARALGAHGPTDVGRHMFITRRQMLGVAR